MSTRPGRTVSSVSIGWTPPGAAVCLCPSEPIEGIGKPEIPVRCDGTFDTGSMSDDSPDSWGKTIANPPVGAHQESVLVPRADRRSGWIDLLRQPTSGELPVDATGSAFAYSAMALPLVTLAEDHSIRTIPDVSTPGIPDNSLITMPHSADRPVSIDRWVSSCNTPRIID